MMNPSNLASFHSPISYDSGGMRSERSSNEFSPPVSYSRMSGEENVLASALEERTVWLREYRDDIFQTLLESEKTRAHISYDSEFAVGRPALLRLMKFIAIQLGLARTTYHLSVYLLDYFMSATHPKDESMRLLAISCLLLAAKVEDPCIPVFTDFNSYMNFEYSTDDYRKMEKRIIRRFNFEFCRPSVATFGELFSPSILTLDEFTFYNYIVLMEEPADKRTRVPTTAQSRRHLAVQYGCYGKMVKHLVMFMLRLCDLCLLDLNFADVPPSLLAAACIMAARRMQRILMDWSAYLTHITLYKYDDVMPYVDRILELYEQDYKFYFPEDYDRVIHSYPAEFNKLAGDRGKSNPSELSWCCPFPGTAKDSPSSFVGISMMTGKPVCCVVQDDTDDAAARMKSSQSAHVYQMCTITMDNSLPPTVTATGGQQAIEKVSDGTESPTLASGKQYYTLKPSPGGLALSQLSVLALDQPFQSSAPQTCLPRLEPFTEFNDVRPAAVTNTLPVPEYPLAASVAETNRQVSAQNSWTGYDSSLDNSHDSGIMFSSYSSRGDLSFNCSVPNKSAGLYQLADLDERRNSADHTTAPIWPLDCKSDI